MGTSIVLFRYHFQRAQIMYNLRLIHLWTNTIISKSPEVVGVCISNSMSEFINFIIKLMMCSPPGIEGESQNKFQRSENEKTKFRYCTPKTSMYCLCTPVPLGRRILRKCLHREDIFNMHTCICIGNE